MKKQYRVLIQALVASLLPAIAWAGPVNVNTADAATLASELDGIGPAKAQAIVEYRQQNGPFRSADDLLKVQGIGERSGSRPATSTTRPGGTGTSGSPTSSP